MLSRAAPAAIRAALRSGLRAWAKETKQQQHGVMPEGTCDKQACAATLREPSASSSHMLLDIQQPTALVPQHWCTGLVPVSPAICLSTTTQLGRRVQDSNIHHCCLSSVSPEEHDAA